jgi:hypothetical protein
MGRAVAYLQEATMQKHKLQLDDISVESFPTNTDNDSSETVKGYAETDEFECGDGGTIFTYICGSCIVTHCPPQVTCTDFTHVVNQTCPPQKTCGAQCPVTSTC